MCIIDIWEERKSKLYGDVECAQQPRPHSPTGDLGEIVGVNGQNSEGMCQGCKPGTGKLLLMYVYVAPPTSVGAWSMALGYGSVLLLYLHNEADDCSEQNNSSNGYPGSSRPDHCSISCF